MQKVWFITGTSQGFGRELVRVALEQGDLVVATSRQPAFVASQFPDHAERLLALRLDLSAPGAAVAAALARFGRIDVLVNNAGHGLLGAIEEVAAAEVAAIFQTNVFGLLKVTQAVLPAMRAQGSGHVVNLSSIAGLTSSPGWGIYASTKFAVEALSEALAQEVAPLGLRVTIVEPGLFRTDFLGSSLHTAAEMPEYATTAGDMRVWAQETHGAQAGDPYLGALAIAQAVRSSEPPLRLLLGPDAYARALAKLDSMRREFERWRDLTHSTEALAPV